MIYRVCYIKLYKDFIKLVVRDVITLEIEEHYFSLENYLEIKMTKSHADAETTELL